MVNGTFALLLTGRLPNPGPRQWCVAVGFNAAFTVLSGAAPLVGTSPIRSSGLSTVRALIVMACGLLTLVGSAELPGSVSE